ncbi:MAG: hypothetical protein A2026_16350 [Deltaproteobacteria bacterium RBG_19FT_COMBO_46_12]|nr:MAG: hypothetical protein A2026_16350 [Deltaproteobacteria bacterium RBG_19FT_COMBO_46_12]
MLDWAMLYTMMGRIETAMTSTTTMMAGFTFIKVVSTVFIMTFRQTSEDITRSPIANITNSIIENILTLGTNIQDTQGTPQEKRNGGNKT